MHALNTVYLHRVEHLLWKVMNRGEWMNVALKYIVYHTYRVPL